MGMKTASNSLAAQFLLCLICISRAKINKKAGVYGGI